MNKGKYSEEKKHGKKLGEIMANFFQNVIKNINSWIQETQ